VFVKDPPVAPIELVLLVPAQLGPGPELGEAVGVGECVGVGDGDGVTPDAKGVGVMRGLTFPLPPEALHPAEIASAKSAEPSQTSPVGDEFRPDRSCFMLGYAPDASFPARVRASGAEVDTGER
jgi:hypothetical protein